MPQAIQPPRDLWAGIETRIAAERDSRKSGADDALQAPPRPKPGAVPSRWLALAATLAALAVGVWIGRSGLPPSGSQPGTPTTAQSGTNPDMSATARALQAAYTSDPRYQKDRAALLKTLQAKLDSLPRTRAPKWFPASRPSVSRNRIWRPRSARIRPMPCCRSYCSTPIKMKCASLRRCMRPAMLARGSDDAHAFRNVRSCAARSSGGLRLGS